MIRVITSRNQVRSFSGDGVCLHQVVTGSGRVEIGGRVHPLTEDGVLLVNRGQPHGVRAGDAAVYSVELDPGWSTRQRFAEALTPRDFAVDRATSQLFGAFERRDRSAADHWAQLLMDALESARDRSTQQYFLAEAQGADDMARLMANARSWVIQRLSKSFRIGHLSAEVGYSEFHFHRAFRAWHGLTPGHYVTTERVRRACRRLVLADEPVTDVAHGCGWQSATSFVRAFRAITGHTPTEFRASRRHLRAEVAFYVAALRSCGSSLERRSPGSAGQTMKA